jgi:hypothetical protein
MNTTISNKTAAYNGALVAVAAVFAYSIIVMLYVIMRSSAIIYSIMPSSERSAILWTNGFSVAYSVAVFSLLMAVASSLSGAFSGILLRKLLLWFNPKRHFNKAILISSVTVLVLLSLLYLLLYILLKERITLQYAETFLFWFLFPAVIFFTVSIISAIAMNKELRILGRLKYQS